MFMDDLLKNDETVKFYTGIPTLACLTAIFNLLKPCAEKLKYWGTNKGKRSQPSKEAFCKKERQKEKSDNLSRIYFEFVRLRLGLLVQHLSDAISKASVSKVFATWICSLAVTLKHVLLIWPSKESVRKNLPESLRIYPTPEL